MLFESNLIVGSQNILWTLGPRPLGMGAWLTPYKHAALPHALIRQIWPLEIKRYERRPTFGVQRENGYLVCRLSMSVKVIELTRINSLLLIRSNCGPISYRFRGKWQFLSKFAKYPTAVHLTSTTKGFPMEFCNGGEAKDTSAMPLPDSR